MRIGFYHLVRSPLDKALPNLLEKAVAAGLRVVVQTGSEERTAWVDTLLWTYADESWLPHGTTRDGDAAEQPVWITAEEENPNGATALVLCDSVMPQSLDGYERVFDLFDGHDEAAVAQARQRWKQWKDLGYALTYHQQNEQGRWEEKAQANLPQTNPTADSEQGTAS